MGPAVPAHVAAAKPYDVSAELLHRGQTFASPSALVQAGVPATIKVSGDQGYTLVMTVTELAADEVRVTTTVATSHGAIEPVMVVRPGRRAEVTVGELGLALTVKHGRN